jgi:hypothetical protein
VNEHISFSEWQLFKNICQWRWKLDYIDGLRSKTSSPSLIFGTAIHSAIEKHKSRKDPLDIPATKLLFESELMRLVTDEKVKISGDELSKLLISGLNIIDRLKECVEFSAAEPVVNEYPLLTKIDRLDGLDINFKGFIDTIVKSVDKRGKPVLWICDYKSCSWGWDGDKRQDQDTLAQLFLYKHFYCKKFDLDPKLVRTAFVLLKKRPSRGSQTVEWFPVSAGPISVGRAVESLNCSLTTMKHVLESGNAQKSVGSCVNKFGDTCPYYNTELCKKA